ncbi:hypothetical protein QTP86_017879 [Hemibagrus guttatus]|nr:hypothetical protein QTP86_017879 [Hemibagrus guttatus]
MEKHALIGQLYMISKHSHEQSERGEGVEVVQNEPFEDPTYGSGQFTEKRVYLNKYIVAVVDHFLCHALISPIPVSCISISTVIAETGVHQIRLSVNHLMFSFPLQCSFLPKFSIHIETKYEDNNGCNDNIFDEPRDEDTQVCFIDIAYDEIPERYYKDSEDLRYFKSEKTTRGLLQEGWRDTQDPIMCSYKLVTVKFEVWGLQTRVEQFVHKVIRDVLSLGHRQAFAWVDEWIACMTQRNVFSPLKDMTMEEVREYERATQEATNKKLGTFPPAINISETPLPSCAYSGPSSAPSTPLSTEAPDFLSVPKDRPRKKSAPETLTLPDPARRDSGFRLPSLFSWASSSRQPE